MGIGSVGFVGGGRVTRFMLGGLKRAGAMPARVIVSDTDAGTLERLKREHPDIAAAVNGNAAAAEQDLVFLALHPPAMPAALADIASHLRPEAVVVSLAPKLTLARLSELLGGFRRIVRMIPNAPSIIGEGYNPVSFSDALDAGDVGELERLFSAWGECPVVPEGDLEAYAILTAMGPTYFWFQWRALSELGRSFGLRDPELSKAVRKMVTGAVDVLYGSGLSPDDVTDLVPVNPLGDEEARITGALQSRLQTLHGKLKA
jgi:pyrroline-5-carboxylate reductase